MSKSNRYSPEVRERAARLVSEEVAADPTYGAAYGQLAVRNYVSVDGRVFKTKTGRERQVPVTRECYELLRRLEAGRTNEDDERTVFTGPGGGPLYPKFRKEAKLPEEIRFHSLRHSCASWMVSRGVSLRVVQEVLGHTSIKSTEIYSHLLPGATDAMVAAFAELRREDDATAKKLEQIPPEKLIAALRELIRS